MVVLGETLPVVEGESSTCRREAEAVKIQGKSAINADEEILGIQFCHMWALAHHLHFNGA